MLTRKIETIAALVLIGDGLLTCVKPSREARAWKFSPEPLRSLMGAMSGRPRLTRVVGVAQVGVGVWLVLRGEKTAKSSTRKSLA